MTSAGRARRAVWGFADQAVSSFINFAVGFLLARILSVDEFGAFSIAFSIYIGALVFGRALASDPLLIRHSGRSFRHWRVAADAASGVALLVGVAAALVMAMIGVVLGGHVGAALIIIAFTLPGLLMLDTMRFAFIARHRPERAFACDVAWLLLIVPTLLLVELTGDRSLEIPIIVWGGSALVVVIAAHALSGTVPSPRLATMWWRRHRDIAPRYAAEAMISLIATQVTIIAVGVLAGLAAAGALRGGFLLLGPILVLFIAFGSVSVPEGAAILREHGPRRVMPFAIGLTLLVSSMALVYGVLLELMPSELGAFLLGETWDSAQTVILPLSVGYLGAATAVGGAIGLRVLADARTSLRARTIDTLAMSIGGVSGAALAGAVGAATGMAIGAWFGSTVIWLSFRASVNRAVAAAARGEPVIEPDAELDAAVVQPGTDVGPL